MLHANPLGRIGLILFMLIVVGFIIGARRKKLFIRRIAGLAAIDDAIGRATEMGRPMVGTTGLSSPGKSGVEIIQLQALSILTYIIQKSAQFLTRTVVPVFDPQMMPVTETAVKEAYATAGHPELFNAGDIRFLTNQQFAFAAATAGMMWREQSAANFYFGYYYAESLILAETGQQIGAIQVAGTPATLQIPFFIAACDYVIIGDEFYAASAYLSQEPTSVGSIVGQDLVKGLMLAAVIVGSVLATVSGLLANGIAATFSGYFLG